MESCNACNGRGTRMYGSSATYRAKPGVFGMSAMTRDICDSCWGSGDSHAPLRSILDIERKAEERGGSEALRDLASAVSKLGLAKEIFDAMTAAMELAVADGRIEGEA